MTDFTLESGVLRKDGRALLCLARAHYGEGAPTAAELEDLSREIVGALNAAQAPAPSLADQFRALIAAGLTSGQARAIFAEADQAEYAGHIAQARENYASEDIEIDDTPEVSAGGDPGVWVAAWVWVRDDDVTPEGDDEDEEQEA